MFASLFFFFFFTCFQTKKETSTKTKQNKKIKPIRVSGAVQHLSNPKHNKNKTTCNKRFTRIIDMHATLCFFSTFKDKLKKYGDSFQKKKKKITQISEMY